MQPPLLFSARRAAGVLSEFCMDMFYSEYVDAQTTNGEAPTDVNCVIVPIQLVRNWLLERMGTLAMDIATSIKSGDSETAQIHSQGVSTLLNDYNALEACPAKFIVFDDGKTFGN